MENSNLCSCGVPYDFHATACGWNNAKMCITTDGVIVLPKEHPGIGMSINDWIDKSKKDAEMKLNGDLST